MDTLREGHIAVHKNVFEDYTGNHWRRVKLLFFVCCALLYTMILLYLVSKFPPYTIYEKLSYMLINLITVLKHTFVFYLMLLIIIGFIRLFILLYFSHRQMRIKKIQRKYRKSMGLSEFTPKVSVLIPVYNEEVSNKENCERSLTK